MRILLKHLRASTVANLYYLSLYAALAIPDICGAIDSSDGKASGAKYKAWFDKYVAPKYRTPSGQLFTGEDCYYFRCSALHQGSSIHPKSTYSRILFVEPGAISSTFHNNILNDALNIDVGFFCNDIVDGAERWLTEVESTTRYQTNYSKFMRRYPNGLPPYIGGVSVIG
jgi:hypothetical protein